MEESYPARLHVVFAKSSANAVVFRRGPSKSVCTLRWNRKKDTFELGQWLKVEYMKGDQIFRLMEST